MVGLAHVAQLLAESSWLVLVVSVAAVWASSSKRRGIDCGEGAEAATPTPTANTKRPRPTTRLVDEHQASPVPTPPASPRRAVRRHVAAHDARGEGEARAVGVVGP
jgi:hypothetical protein